MTWYAAHIIIGVKRRDGKGSISAMENVVLLEAESFDEAERLALERGEEYAYEDDTLTLNGKPAVFIFVGVRKILTVSNPAPLHQNEDRPISGTEITFSEFEVPDDEALRRLGEGKTLDVLYLE